jgi:hypothetical protein
MSADDLANPKRYWSSVRFDEISAIVFHTISREKTRNATNITAWNSILGCDLPDVTITKTITPISTMNADTTFGQCTCFPVVVIDFSEFVIIVAIHFNYKSLYFTKGSSILGPTDEIQNFLGFGHDLDPFL